MPLSSLYWTQGPTSRAGQQPHGSRDEIVEVEEAARRLQLLVARDHPVGDGQRDAVPSSMRKSASRSRALIRASQAAA